MGLRVCVCFRKEKRTWVLVKQFEGEQRCYTSAQAVAHHDQLPSFPGHQLANKPQHITCAGHLRYIRIAPGLGCCSIECYFSAIMLAELSLMTQCGNEQENSLLLLYDI